MGKRYKTTTMTSASTTTTVLVLGATGATGKHVVAQLLSQKSTKVKAIVRSADRLHNLLKELGVDADDASSPITSQLDIMEAAVLDVPTKDVMEYTADVDVVICCLGHNLTFRGIFGHPKTLVTDAVTCFYQALQTHQKSQKKSHNKKFLLMGSDGVAWEGHDDARSFIERCILSLLRYCIPPHRDNETAAAYLLSQCEAKQDMLVPWVIVRPTDLVNNDVATPATRPATTATTPYQLFGKPQGSLFGSGTAHRTNVADCLVELTYNGTLFEQWKFHMPVLLDDNKSEETKKVQ